jgi:hypothetical protein
MKLERGVAAHRLFSVVAEPQVLPVYNVVIRIVEYTHLLEPPTPVSFCDMRHVTLRQIYEYAG